MPCAWDKAPDPGVVEESFVLSAISGVGIGGRRETVPVPNVLDVQVQTLYRICQSRVDTWCCGVLAGSTRDRLRRRNRLQGRVSTSRCTASRCIASSCATSSSTGNCPGIGVTRMRSGGAVVREEGGGEESMDSNHADGSLICLRKGRAK